MENYLYISSNTPSIVFANNVVIGTTMQNDDYLAIKTDEHSIVLQCLPVDINKNMVANIINLDNPNLSFCTNTKILKLSPFHYKIFFELPDCIVHKHTTLLHSTTLNNCTLSLFDSTMQFVIIKNENYTKNIYLNYHIIEPKFVTFLQYYALLGKTKNQDYILVFDEHANIMFEDVQDVIEIAQDCITTLQKICDIANHGFVSKYQLANSTLHLKEQYSVYLDEHAHMAPCVQAVGLAFVEAININNLALARSYLNVELSSALTDNKLTQFFGDYVEFEPNFLQDANNNLFFIYPNNIVKNYRFVIDKNQKITDIIVD